MNPIQAVDNFVRGPYNEFKFNFSVGEIYGKLLKMGGEII